MRSIKASMSFAMIVFRCHRDAGAMHEDDLPVPCLFLQKGRFQPFLVHRAGGVSDAAFIDVGNPSHVAADVDVWFGHVPFIALARGMLGLYKCHDGFSVESGASIIYVKVCRNHGVELRNIVCSGCSEYRAHGICDLSLVGSDGFLLGSSQ